MKQFALDYSIFVIPLFALLSLQLIVSAHQGDKSKDGIKSLIMQIAPAAHSPVIVEVR